MITEKQYFGQKPHTEEHEVYASEMLHRVNEMLVFVDYDFPVDPDTGTCISGSKGGSGDGGFRLPESTTGAKLSSHKEAKAVDVFDPENWLDNYLDQFDEPDGGNPILERFGLYREASPHTPGWCHLTTRPPKSGRRSFNI